MCSFAFLIASPQSVTIPPLEHPSSEANLGAVKCMPDIHNLTLLICLGTLAYHVIGKLLGYILIRLPAKVRQNRGSD